MLDTTKRSLYLMTHRLFSLFLLLSSPLLAQEEKPIDLSDAGGFADQFFHMILSLIFVLALLVGGAWLLKKLLGQRMVQMNASSEIKIIERRPLSPKSALYLIEVENKKILLGETATEIRSLLDLTKQNEDL